MQHLKWSQTTKPKNHNPIFAAISSTTIAFLAILSLFYVAYYGIYATLSNNDSFCEELVSNSSKHLKSKDIHDAFTAALFSSIAYLRYEKIGDEGEEDKNLAWFPSEITMAKYPDHWPEKAAVHARMMFDQLHAFGQQNIEKLHRRLSRLYRKNNSNNEQSKNITSNASSKHTKQKQSWHSDREKFHIRWFFGNFQDDDGWHDVEVLLAESASTIVIAFRGSDTLADLLTNSQPMNDIPSSSRFHGDAKGKVLGGMLAAFETVSHGRITQITSRNTPTAHGVLGEGSLIHQTFVHACAASKRVVTQSNDTVFTRCEYQPTHDDHHPQHEDTLADILLETIFAAQERHKRVLITGHSLGAALAALLAYDHTLILHSQKSRLALRKWAKQERHRLTHPVTGHKHSLHAVVEYNHSISVKQLLARSQSSKLVNNTNKHSQHSFHDLLSIKKHALLPKLITFGEPQFCDYAFIASLSNILQPLLKHRTWSFITLGGTDCKPDLVTELLKTLSSVLGRQFLGFDSVLQKKERRQQQQRQQHHDSGAVISLTGDSFGGLQIDLQDSEESKEHEVLRLSPQQLRQLKEANAAKETKQLSSIDDPMTIHPLLRKHRVFVNSFAAASSVDAHALQHYLRGVLLLAVKHNDRQAYITASSWWQAMKRMGKGLQSSLPLMLAHDLSNATTIKLNLVTTRRQNNNSDVGNSYWRPQLTLRDVALI